MIEEKMFPQGVEERGGKDVIDRVDPHRIVREDIDEQSCKSREPQRLGEGRRENGQCDPGSKGQKSERREEDSLQNESAQAQGKRSNQHFDSSR